MSTRKNLFLQKYGEDYGYQGKIDELRNTEFTRLKDHAGTTLHTDSQLRQCFEDISNNLYGNPHSANSLGHRTSQSINKIRDTILQFFNTSNKNYSVIFTSGCTSALKLVGETFPWTPKSKFLYLNENHNSVIGIREYALANGASFQSLTIDELSLIDKTSPTYVSDAYHLIAFPAENNFSGAKTPLQIIEKNLPNGNCKILLDVASFVGHSQLDLTKFPADFVTLSFYKIFGYPTGLGALIIRNDNASILKKTYFGGGTVAATLSDEHFSLPREGISERFEDGTISFLNITSLKYGFQAIQKFGISNIEKHTHALVQYLYSEMSKLEHFNGAPVCVVYGNHYLNDSSKSGPIFTFNLKISNGDFVGYHEVEQLAGLNNIYVRTGCFCNPGACYRYLNLSKDEVLANLEAGHVCWDDKDIIKGKPTGAVRVSLGYMSTFEDIEKFLDFIKKYFVQEKKTQEIFENENSELVLSNIFVYPIKSCGRFEVTEWDITSNGLNYDREWVLVDDNGTYLNQKKFPRMSLIRPTIEIPSNSMFINAPGMTSLKIDLLEFPENEISLQVCGDSCYGYRYSEKVNDWFSSFLESRCYLVRNKLEGSTRISGGRDVRSQERREGGEIKSNEECKISYSNESQFLIVSEASVKDVNSRLKKGEKEVNAATFRPNLVIKGGSPYQEDEWQKIVIGDQIFKILGPCNRCKMICVNQDTAIEGKEPLLTLASYRRNKGKILFGSHANHIASSTLPHTIKCNSKVLYHKM